MANTLASFLVGLIAGFLICVAAVDATQKDRAAAGAMIVDGKAYRVTPMEAE